MSPSPRFEKPYSASRTARSRRRKLALAAIGALLFVVGLTAALAHPFFLKVPLNVIRYESFTSMSKMASWIYYLHGFKRQLRWNETAGVMDFSAALASLEEASPRDHIALGKMYWHVGSFAEAVGEIEEHHRKQGESEESLFWLALSYMRLAEARNCLEPLLASESHAHPHICSLPLDAHHRRTLHSRNAAEHFERLLDRYDSENALYRWLLNFSHMTTDGFPDQVPAEYRIDGPLVDAFYGTGKEAMASKYSRLRLEDRARELGVATFDSGSGVAVEDFDGDGFLDIVTSGGYTPLRFYRNTGDGGFEDRSRESGLDAIQGTHLISAADYDNDGWMDLFISRVMGSRIGDFLLLRNEGEGRFRDVTVSSGLLPPEEERSRFLLTWASTWADLENDGDLDLLVAAWGGYNGIDSSRHRNPLARNLYTRLYRQEDGRFVDITREAGLASFIARRNIFGGAFGDYDGDGFPDLALTPQEIPGIVLFHNEEGRRFVKTDLIPSEAWGFMTAFLDVDHDGLLDLFVGGTGSAYGATQQAVLGDGFDRYNSQSAIWVQQPDGTFLDRSDFFAGDLPIGTMGCSFGDINNDGAWDFYLGTGDPEGWFVLPNLMYVGKRDGGRPTGEMDNISMLFGLGTVQKGHGIVFFDFDEDGDQDIYSSLGGMWPGDAWPNQFFINESQLEGTWTKIRLRGTRSNLHGVGARIAVLTEHPGGNRETTRYYMSSKTAFGSAPYRAHLGLGDAERIVQVEVIWPGSRVPTIYSAELERLNVLEEGGGNLTELSGENRRPPGAPTSRSSPAGL